MGSSHLHPLVLVLLAIFNTCQSEPQCAYSEDSDSYECTNKNITNFDDIPEKNWTNIDISSNQISVIREYQFNGSAWSDTLTSLSIDNNTIQYIQSHAFAGLSVLDTLELSHNQLQYTISESAFEIPTLTYLELRNCNITELPPKLFQHLCNLTDLVLSKNKISLLPDNLFENVTNIISLYLDNNKIENITNLIFRGLGNLTSLSLSNNRIKVMGESAFLSQLNFKFLDLKGNNLAFLKLETIMPLINNKLNTTNDFLADNPWNCCELHPVLHFCQNVSNNCPVGLTIMCAEPIEYANMTWRKEQFNNLTEICFPSTSTTTTIPTTIGDTKSTREEATIPEELPTAPEDPPTTADNSPKITEVPELADNTTEIPEVTTMFAEASNCSQDSENGTTTMWGCSKNRRGKSPVQETGGGMCEFQYYFLGGYAIFVFIVACTVWVIMCRVRKYELSEHLHFE